MGGGDEEDPPRYDDGWEKKDSKGMEGADEQEKEMEKEKGRSGEVWFTARIPGFIPPSFKSFAITRVYRIKVKLGVELGGKQFVLEAESNVSGLGSAPA